MDVFQDADHISNADMYHPDHGLFANGDADLPDEPFVPPADVYFVAPDGDDSYDGSFNAPWATFSHATSMLRPHDTLYLRAGEYREELRPEVDGIQGEPIYIRAFDDETVVIAEVERPLHVRNRSHIQIYGLTLRDPIGQWALVRDSENIVIERVHADVTRAPDNETTIHEGFEIRNSSFVTLRDLDLVGWRHTDTDRFDGHVLSIIGTSSHILVEGGFYGASGNSALEFVGAHTVVVRDALIDNPWDSCVGIYDSENIYIVDNIIRNCGTEREKSGTGIESRNGYGIVIRGNIIHGSWETGIRFRATASASDLESLRLAHNTVVGNNRRRGSVTGGIELDDGGNDGVGIVDVVVANNIVYRNEPSSGGNETQLYIRDAGQPSYRDVMVFGNIFSNLRAQTCELNLLSDLDGGGACPITIGGLQNADVAWFEENESTHFVGNSEQDPRFVSMRMVDLDLRLEEGSPARHTARPLAEVTSSGRSDLVPLSDARHFYGDLLGHIQPEAIMVGSERVGVLRANYQDRTLKLDRTIDFAQGSPVTIPHGGSGPNIGAHQMR